MIPHSERTHDSCDDERQETQSIVGIWLENAGGDLMELEACDAANSEDVEPCGEDDRVNETRAAGCARPRLGEDGEQEATEHGSDSCKLWTLPEWNGKEEGPARERKTEEEMHDKD